MIQNDKQEQLSLAVLHAICAKAGFAFSVSNRIQDNWGWDACADIKEKLDTASSITNFRIRFQVKATRQQLIHSNGRFSFPLQIKHYNEYRRSAGNDSPIYLVVFLMPTEEVDWMLCTSDQLVLRRCLYWVSLRNAPAPVDDDQETITVYIPDHQLLTPDALRAIAKARSLEQWLDYEHEGVSHANYS